MFSHFPSLRLALTGVTLLFWLAAAPAHASGVERVHPEEIVSLAVDWKFQTGDNSTWAAPGYDDAQWSQVRIPSAARSDVEGELAWYRLELRMALSSVSVPDTQTSFRLGLSLGKIDSAYEVYAGGQLLGGVGSLPPAPLSDYDQHRIYPIPAQAIDDSGRLVLALRVWKDQDTAGKVGYPYEGPFLLGPIEELTRRELVSELPSLFLAGLFVVIGLFHLELFRRRPQLSGYLWFCGCSLSFAGYIFLRTQWKYTLGDHFLLFKEMEYLLLFLMVAGFIQLVWPLVGLRITPSLRAYQGLNVATGFLVAATPGLRLNLFVLPYWQLSMVALILYGFWAVFREAWRQHPEAHLVAIGALGSGLAFLNDIAVDNGFYVGPRIVAFGFAFLVLTLAASLANQFMRTHKELEQLRSNLEKRVQERTHQLVAANQAKTRFLATMSHEIRTPLNGVIGTTDLLLNTELSAEQRELIEVARNSGDAVLVLIDDILDFSKIEAGKFELETRPFRLRDCIEASLDLLAARAAEKGLDLAYVADPQIPMVVGGDGVRLRQILVNLLGNAVKFTDEGGILLDVGLGQGEASEDQLVLHFRVVDTGIGIPAHLLGKLFESFSQVDDSDSRQHQGTGLGLAISRRLCELMSGKMWVESEPGKGSTFHFTLPVAPEAVAIETFLDSQQVALEGKTALILEQSPFTRQALVDWLESWGMTPSVTGSIEQAVERIRQGDAFDVAIVGRHASHGDQSSASLDHLGAEAPGMPWIVVKWLAMTGQTLPAERSTIASLTAPVKPAELYSALLDVLEPRPSTIPETAVSLRQATSEPAPIAAPSDSDSLKDAHAPQTGMALPSARIEVPPPIGDSEIIPMSILLAEDDLVNQTVTLRMLERLGCPADCVVNGLEALEALAQRSYDVVLLDIQMPELDGLETARRIRTRWSREQGPWLIAVTANALRGDREKCLAAGMDDYVSKPLKCADLKAALERCQEAVAAFSTPPAATAIPDGSAATGPDAAESSDATVHESLVLDPNVLQSLRELDDGEGDILRETVEVFLSTTPARIDGLDTAIATGDMELVERLAHTLKSSSGMIGGQRMAEVCKRLERTTNAGTVHGASELVTRIGQCFVELRAELTSEFASG